MIRATTYFLAILLIFSACGTNNKTPLIETAKSDEMSADSASSQETLTPDQSSKENLPGQQSAFRYTTDQGRLEIYRSNDDSLIFSDSFVGETYYHASAQSMKDTDLFTIHLEAENDAFIVVCDQTTGKTLVEFHATGEESSYYADFRDVSRSASQQLLKMDFYTSSIESSVIFKVDTNELIAKLCSFGSASWASDIDAIVYMDCTSFEKVDSLPQLERYHAYFFEKKWQIDTTLLTGKYISSYLE